MKRLLSLVVPWMVSPSVPQLRFTVGGQPTNWISLYERMEIESGAVTNRPN
jgi:hypothetical protein